MYNIRTLNNKVIEYSLTHSYKYDHEVNQFKYDTGEFYKFGNNKIVEFKNERGTFKNKRVKVEDGIDPVYGTTKWKTIGHVFKKVNAPTSINPPIHKLEVNNPLICIYAGKPFRFHLIIVGYKVFALPLHKQIDKLLENVEPLTFLKIEYNGKGQYDNNKYTIHTGDKYDPIGDKIIIDNETKIKYEQKPLFKF